MNDPTIFPDLHFQNLSDLAKGWAENYPVIQKVTLYQGKREGLKGYRSTKYVLVVKVRIFIKMPDLRSLPDLQPTSENTYLDTPSQDSSQEYMRFLKWSFGGESCWHIHDELANAYVGEPPGSYELEWGWYTMSSEDDIPTEWILSSVHWILYEKEKEEKSEVTTVQDDFAEKKRTILPCEPGTEWEDIVITLVANDTVRIETPEGKRLYSYHKLDMEDKRSGDKPRAMWALLKIFAKNQGFISHNTIEYNPRLPDNARLLNKHLKRIFGIKDSIYTGHYKKERGYRTRIRFHNQTY